MSCPPGGTCEEGLKRRRALAALGLMGVAFIGLSLASFLDIRGQAEPATISYTDYSAVDGKRVFQAYNCMGCHTIVGNGAYFAPDLTKLYATVGPAWLEAFLPSAGAWPTSGAVRLQLQNAAIAAEAGVDSIDSYLEKYPAAAERIRRRSAHVSQMPNLPLSRDDVGKLIAFMKYTATMNTEGWPPKPAVDGLVFSKARPAPGTPQVMPAVAQLASAQPEPAAATEPPSPAVRGAELARDTGCMACHSSGGERLVGPGWGGLYGANVSFADGSKALADDAYITEAIVDPDARIVEGFTPHMMPSYAGMLGETEVAAIVAYIRSLGGEHR